jgi:hypothetical protein
VKIKTYSSLNILSRFFTSGEEAENGFRKVILILFFLKFISLFLEEGGALPSPPLDKTLS